MMGLWDAVASAGPHANSLQLAPDIYPHQHLITQFLQAGCPAYSVKALKTMLKSSVGNVHTSVIGFLAPGGSSHEVPPKNI